jgi:hypothetical protein
MRFVRPSAVFASLVLVIGFIGAGAAQAVEPVAKKSTGVVALLNTLTVQPEQRDGYDRDLFRHWVTTDGCDTRQWVLIRQTLKGKVNGCTVTGGQWYSAYDGVTTDNARTFDIDHMVPLAESWDSGARMWSADQRKDFANDLTYKPSLIAVSASSNRSKSDQDPAEWMPPLKSDWCQYLKSWVGVKYRWQLTVDAAEKTAIKQNLKSANCGKKMATPPVAPVAN